MNKKSKPVLTSIGGKTWDGGDTPFAGGSKWVTLFDHAITPTNELTTGIMQVEPGNTGVAHHHAQAETYYVLDGSGVIEVADQRFIVGQGDAVFVPGNARHAVVNTGDAPLRILYTFAANGMDEINYVFEDGTKRTL